MSVLSVVSVRQCASLFLKRLLNCRAVDVNQLVAVNPSQISSLGFKHAPFVVLRGSFTDASRNVVCHSNLPLPLGGLTDSYT